MSSSKTKKMEAQKAAVKAAIESVGLGYDLAEDLKLKYCKRSSRLIVIDDDQVRDLVVPAGIAVRNVPKSIKCDKGERLRFASDVLSFQQMSEQFNQELSLSGKIPSGHFNAAFEFTGGWQKDAANTKTLAFDGVSVTLYNIALEKSQVVLHDHVKQAVPSSWDPAALARFVEKYGTHIIVGVKIGGKDLIYAKQQHSSSLQPADVQKKLKDMADKMFVEGTGQYNVYSNERPKFTQGLPFMDTIQSGSYYYTEMQDIKFACKRKGGSLNKTLSHNDWCQTVQFEPDVISMSFVPITSLLSGINGSGFLSHAINLYLRYKPPIQELHQFLEFQLPRQWAPVLGDIPLGPDRKQSSASLQFSFMGPKLYVNTTPVDVGKKPVTGLRLYLEGKRSNCLGIHLQHLSSQPKTFQLLDEPNGKVSYLSSDRRYYEKVQWKSFSHVCTAPVESDDDLSVVTGAYFEVGDSGLKKVLFLRLNFSKVIGAIAVKAPEWDGSPGLAQKSGIISTLISTRFSNAQKPPPRPADVNINSAVYPGGPPVPTQTPKLLRFVDTTEMTRGPHPDEPAVKTQTITVAVKDQLSKWHGTINSFPPLVFVMNRYGGRNLAIGLCIAIALLVIAVRVYAARKLRYRTPGSVADLVRRGQLRSDRRGISRPLMYEDPFNNPMVKVGKSNSTVEMCGKVYRLAPVTLTEEEQAIHQKRRSRAYQWKRPTVFLKEGESVPADVDPDTIRWIPANHPFATTASDIDEDLAQNNVYQKHGVPFRIKAEHEAMQRKLEALQSEQKLNNLMIDPRNAKDFERPFKEHPRSREQVEQSSFNNQTSDSMPPTSDPAPISVESNSSSEETQKL